MSAARCVITLGISDPPPADHPQVVRDFRPGIRRLEASLVRAGYDGNFAFWDETYPAGSPSHQASPCGYKPFCFFEAAAAGYDLVLWLDATVEVIRPIDHLFQLIEQDGYLLFAEDHSVGEYCKDEALAPLGITREESFALPSCWACAVGLDLRQPRSREFLARWQALAVDGVTFPGPRWSGVRGYPPTASTDPRVKGHRYDQTAASVLAHRLGLTTWKPKDFFHYFLRNNRRSIPTQAVRPPAEQARSTLSAAKREAGAQEETIRVLFFSRGRGRGHAVPDMAIADEFPQLDGEIDVQFASYATGADTLREAGWSVIDLGLPEANPFVHTLTTVHTAIREVQPHVVVSHEEYTVPPAAHMAGVPAILMTDWFPPPNTPGSESVAFADSIVFIGEKGVFALPPGVTREPVFVGPVVRKMAYSRADRARARSELGWPAEAFAITMLPGAWATEERAPVADLLLAAFAAMGQPEKFLCWLTKADHAALAARTAGDSRIRVLRDCPAVDQFIVASDVVVTKGNRGSIMDAASLGIPTVSLSHGQNRIDDVWVARVPSNQAFNVRETTPAALAAHLDQLASIAPAERALPLDLHRQGGKPAALALVAEIRRLLPKRL